MQFQSGQKHRIRAGIHVDLECSEIGALGRMLVPSHRHVIAERGLLR